MSLDTDTVLEQRRLRRRLVRWRTGAVLLGALALLAVVGSGESGFRLFNQGNHIARVDIAGLITEDRDQIEMLRKAADDASVKAIVLAVNSPGGTTTGGEALYNAIEAATKKKPVVAVQGTIATSAAYMISLASDRIFAHGNTITGSVGVIFQFPEVHEALDKIGVKMNEIKSGPLKAVPSMFAPLDDQGRQLAQSMVAESQVWFLGLVTKRRNITAAAVPGLEAGRIYSGREALQYKLVDAIGDEQDAIAWLEKEKGVAAALPVVDWKPKRKDPFGGFLGEAGGGTEGGIAGIVHSLLARTIGSDRLAELQLDGLVSVWHGGN